MEEEMLRLEELRNDMNSKVLYRSEVPEKVEEIIKVDLIN